MIHASDEFLVLDDATPSQHIEDECQDRQQVIEIVRMELALKSEVLSADNSYSVAYPEEDEENADCAETHLKFPVLEGDDGPQVERTGDEQQDKQRPYGAEIPCAVGHHVPEVVHYRISPHRSRLKIAQGETQAHHREDECQEQVDGLNALPHN